MSDVLIILSIMNKQSCTVEHSDFAR